MNLTFRMLQHTSSEVTVLTITNKFKRKSERLAPYQENGKINSKQTSA